MGNNKKGKNMYVPPVVIDELEDIQREDGIEENVLAFKEFTNYARVGREVKRIMKLDWRGVRRLPPISAYPSKKKKGRGEKDLFGGDLL